VACWLVWTTSSLLGAALAARIPPAWGLGFAGVLGLLATMIMLATSWQRLVAAGVAGVVAIGAYAWPLKLNILVAIAAAIAAGLAAERLRGAVVIEREPGEEHP